MGLLISLRNKLHGQKKTFKFIMKGGRDELIGGRRRRRRTHRKKHRKSRKRTRHRRRH